MLIGVAVVVLAAYTGYQGLKARTALTQVAADFQALPGQLTSGDKRSARASVTDAQRHSRVAEDSTHGPGWWLAGKLPTVGPNVRAVQTVADVSQRVSFDVLPDVVDVSGTLSPDRLRPRNGRIALAPIRRVAPAVERVSQRLGAQSRVVQAIDPAPLAPEVARPVTQLRDRIETAALAADRASRTVRLLPAMLGGDGPRRYLFAFQDNAEIRATGGIPGSFGLLSARDGKLQFSKIGSGSDLGSPFATPVERLTPQEQSLFGSSMGRYAASTNFTPDFPRTAQLLSAMWRRSHSSAVDGVVSVDPIALSFLLRGTGPVPTAGGRTLSAGNAVDLLLSKVYAQISDPQAQNDFFSTAAEDTFAAVTSGKGQARAVLTNVAKGASERRILVWSSHAKEQRLIVPTAVGGALTTRTGHAPQVGVFLNSTRPSKLDYYLDYHTVLRATSCRRDRQHLRATMTLRSRVPKPLGPEITSYVAPRNTSFSLGSLVPNVYVYAPPGGVLTRLRVDGKRVPLGIYRLDGRQVVVRTLPLEPGRHVTISADMLSGPGQTADPQLRVTPGVRSTGIGAVDTSACQ